MKNLNFKFYKGSYDFPISGVDTCTIDNAKSIDRVIRAINPLIDKTTNIRFDGRCINHIFIKSVVLFLKEEGLNYTDVLSWTVSIACIDQFSIYISIVFNKGQDGDISILSI